MGGIFKIDSKEYVPLAGHLSTKSCENVCMLSRSLRALVNVTKHSKLEVWPASLGTSSFTDENIALPDGKLDQLVKEVIEYGLALRAVMGKTEMLIFPSTMLPKQYQAFQGKHYLWGLFRPRKDIVGVAEEQAAHAMCLENQEGSKDGTEQVEFHGVPDPNMDTEPQDPEAAEMQDAADRNMAPPIGGSNASRANHPSMAATQPANREQIDPSLGIPQGRIEDLLRDGKDGGLRISDECSEHSTANQIKHVKRKLEGCSQERILNALGREEDDVVNVESTRGRKG
uniref:AIPP2-like SPOC-like domain-containing protein n=1 Tax=Oryza glumipatula TaxID=40148 RepID=A0A0E0BPC1_9ORYZ